MSLVRSEKGFAHILVTLVLIVAFVAGVAGTVVWKNSQKKASPTAVVTNNLPTPLPVTEKVEPTAIVLTPSIKPTASPSATPVVNYEKRISSLEDTVFDLQNRLTTVEKASPSPIAIGSQSTVTKYPIYLYFDASTSGNSTDWTTSTYPQLEIDTSDYAGYTSMQLEVTFKLFQGNGTGYVRLYNNTDGTAVDSSDVSTSSQDYVTVISNKFGITNGKKIYRLQTKSLTGYAVDVLSARIRINF